jgi:DNA polymerase-3 subunit gamma/tau
MSDSKALPARPAALPSHGDNYLVVARRYRPQTFDELIGQQHVARALCGAITTNRVGHAYLFAGARGIGKTSAARILAKALNCIHGPTPTPCNTCDVCQGITEGFDVDVIEIDGASNRTIDEIRQLRANVGVRPSRARFKIYIIDEVHMLTREAFQALLKTLEEPPGHVKFVFCTTNPEKMPVTVLSRCQRFDFAPIETQQIVDRLAEIVVAEGARAEPEALELLARRVSGSMRDSQSLLEELLAFAGNTITTSDVHQMLGTADASKVTSLVKCLLHRDASAALHELDGALAQGVDVGQLAEQLVGILRDILIVASGCEARLLLFARPADYDELKALGEQFGFESLLATLQVFDEAIVQMRQSPHRRTLVELAVVRACHLEQLDDLRKLVRALEDPTAQVVVPGAADPGPRGALKKKVEPDAPLPDRGPPPADAGSTLDTVPSAERRRGEPAAGPRFPGPLTDDMAARVWEAALATLSGVDADVARQFEQVRVGGPDQLVVRFRSAYNADRCQRPEQYSRITAALERQLGRSIRVDFESPNDVDQRVQRPRIKSQRELIRESYAQPLVRQAVELFGAEVTRVEFSDDRGSKPC